MDIQTAAYRGREGRGDMWLFFGCRNEKQDWIFREEMEAFLSKGVLTRLSTAFSRDTADKVYVQVQSFSLNSSIVSQQSRMLHGLFCAGFFCVRLRLRVPCLVFIDDDPAFCLDPCILLAVVISLEGGSPVIACILIAHSTSL